MASGANASQSTVVNRARETLGADHAKRAGFLSSLRDRVSALLKEVGAQHEGQRGQELELAIWALGYAGFTREAARLFRKSRRAAAGV